MKKVCIITGSRAEWGLFYPLACELKKNNNDIILQIVATGAHLSPDFGLTYKEIEKDGFQINRKVATFLSGDTEEIIAKSVGSGIAKLAEVLKFLKPDLVLLLGDRFETFSAAVACLFLKIPVAHIHGGELTEGSLDDALRHAITKMAYLHFTATDVYRKRVIQMGEAPSRVFNVGAPGLDNIRNANLLDKKKFEEKINFKLGKKNIMITFNPSTLEKKEITENQFKNLLKVIDKLPDLNIIFTKPNADIYSKTIVRLMDNYVSKNNGRAVSFVSMGRELYLSALQFMDVVAGNSSSGIIEVPSFGIPTINIGNRQKGRIVAASIINAGGSYRSIQSAFRKAFSKSFQKQCENVNNSYGDGTSSQKIINIIKKTDFSTVKKKFFDLNFKGLIHQ